MFVDVALGDSVVVVVVVNAVVVALFVVTYHIILSCRCSSVAPKG